MPTWQSMSSAPRDGRPILLRLSKPLALLCDPVEAGPLNRCRVVIGWYAPTLEKLDWEICAVEQGDPDSGGWAACFAIRVEPVAWQDLPDDDVD